MPPSSRYRHLLFRAEMEVNPDYKSEVTTLLPRVVDVLNGYLRALDISDIEAPSALTRLRAQMLRRVQIVAGPGRVNDLLIVSFSSRRFDVLANICETHQGRAPRALGHVRTRNAEELGDTFRPGARPSFEDDYARESVCDLAAERLVRRGD